jgi:hypothetical protein
MENYHPQLYPQPGHVDYQPGPPVVGYPGNQSYKQPYIQSYQQPGPFDYQPGPFDYKPGPVYYQPGPPGNQSYKQPGPFDYQPGPVDYQPPVAGYPGNQSYKQPRVVGYPGKHHHGNNKNNKHPDNNNNNNNSNNHNKPPKPHGNKHPGNNHNKPPKPHGSKHPGKPTGGNSSDNNNKPSGDFNLKVLKPAINHCFDYFKVLVSKGVYYLNNNSDGKTFTKITFNPKMNVVVDNKNTWTVEQLINGIFCYDAEKKEYVNTSSIWKSKWKKMCKETGMIVFMKLELNYIKIDKTGGNNGSGKVSKVSEGNKVSEVSEVSKASECGGVCGGTW